MSDLLFISYAVEDRAYVATLAARLEHELGLQAWWFERDEQYGVYYREEIIRQIGANCSLPLPAIHPR